MKVKVVLVFLAISGLWYGAMQPCGKKLAAKPFVV